HGRDADPAQSAARDGAATIWNMTTGRPPCRMCACCHHSDFTAKSMLLNPQFIAEQILNSLQFSMLLFLLAIGLSVVFGLMDYLNLSHGTIYMLAAYAAFTITQLGGSFWIALLLAPCVAAVVGVLLYQVLLKRAQTTGHLTQVLLTV